MINSAIDKFTLIKDSIPLVQAIEYYGLHPIKRGGTIGLSVHFIMIRTLHWQSMKNPFIALVVEHMETL